MEPRVAFPQSTVEEFIDSERLMVLTARERYGRYYTHALGCAVFMSRCIEGVDHDRSMIFGRLFSQMKKHQMLALLSAVRLHKVQAMMNLRQVLEAGAAASFAIANPELRHFADTDKHGLLDPSQPLAKKRYAWLHQNFRDKSEWIKDTKERINKTAAHANVVSADSVFRVAESGDSIEAPFFDIEDEYHVKTDLLLIGSVGLTLLDLFYGVNKNWNVLGFRPDFANLMGHMSEESNILYTEMRETSRFKRAKEKFGLPNR